MIIKRTSPITGLTVELDIDVTDEQIRLWESGGLIQDIMPGLTADEREFIISGFVPGEFDLLFSSEEKI